jgi:hypothetical protein
MPIPSRQERRAGNHLRGVKEELYMLMIGMLGDDFGESGNEIQALL